MQNDCAAKHQISTNQAVSSRATANRERSDKLTTRSGRWVFTLALIALALPAVAFAQERTSDPTLQIDVPTRLEKANVVIDFGHTVFNGDAPFAIGDIGLLESDLEEWNAKGQIIVIFHGDAAYFTLNDETYNANRHVSAGNPYKKMLAGLMDKGVQLELCGATAKGNHWGNANLLPGVKVNVNAMVRLTQLEQEGYSMIYE
jgi:intracellular sulfur oxidation DsrE/DsrF family protein